MAVKASSQVTLVDVSDSYSVTLTSEAYTFTGGTGGAASGLTCTTQALAFCGTTQCTSVSITASAIICPTGIKAAVTNDNTSAPTVTFTTTATITASCEATIPVVVNGITINKKFSFAVAKTGATGAQGTKGADGANFQWNLLEDSWLKSTSDKSKWALFSNEYWKVAESNGNILEAKDPATAISSDNVSCEALTIEVDAKNDALSGQTVTLSFEVLSDDFSLDGSRYGIQIGLYGSNNGTSWTYITHGFGINNLIQSITGASSVVNKKWSKISAARTVRSVSDLITSAYTQYKYVIRYLVLPKVTGSTYFAMRHFKLEYGSTASEWCTTQEETIGAKGDKGDTGATGSTAKRAGAIKASAAITAGNLIVGNSSGYHHLKTGGTFDISYGVLYADSAISSGSTGTDNYTTINFTVTTTQSISLTAYKAVYIKGKLAGPTFTPISTAPLTQTVPTSADGYYYMLVGTATSTTTISLGEDHAVYRYLNGKFQAMGSTADETVLNWCKGTDLTYIDGGKLYANSVTAAKIDVDDLFAQNITATNMHITGDSTFDGDITARSLTLGDGTKVHMEWGTDTEWGSYAAEIYYNNNNNPYCGIEVNIEGAGIHTYAKNSSGTITSQADVSLEASGYAYITATKGLAVRGYAHPQITCKRYASDTNAISFGVGSGGTNRGVFDETNSKWMLHTDGSKLYLDNDVCMTLQTSGFFRKFGRVVVCRIYGTLTTALGTIPSAYRPVENMSAPATILYNSNGFSAYVVFTTSGSITSKFYKDAEAPKDPASGCKIYCDAVWIAAS